MTLARAITFATALASLALSAGACASDPQPTEEQSGEEALVAASTRPAKRFLTQGDPNRRVLVVLSAADTIDLIPDANHSTDKFVTGVFARELSEPLKVLAEHGYSFDFATPGGLQPTWDVNGLELPWFFWGDSHPLASALGSGQARDEAVSLLMEAFGSLKLSDKRTLSRFELPDAIRHWQRWQQAEGMQPSPPKSLADVATAIAGGAGRPYVALLVPGGHAPMTDLAFDPNMATIVRHFHDEKKPVGVVCHGPVALMATTGKTDLAGWQAMTADERAAWPYNGYTITAESTIEEHIMEKAFAGGQRVTYYVDGELERAGAKLAQARPAFVPGLAKVSADRELVSGQSPASANCLGQVLAESIELSEQAPRTNWWTDRRPVACDGQ